MGTVGSKAMYVQELNHILMSMSKKITLERINFEILASSLTEMQKKLILMRLKWRKIH